MEAKNAQKYLLELHQTNNEWLSELAFAKDEIMTNETRLSEVDAANTAIEVKAQVEHFQNQFIRHKEVIDELKAEIHHFETKLADIAISNNVATDHRKSYVNTSLTEEMEQFRKIFGELRVEYLQFLARTY
jgi:hypothetical protein